MSSTKSANRPRVPIGGFAPPSSGPPMQRIYSEKADERVHKHYSLQFTSEADERYYEPSDVGDASRQLNVFADGESPKKEEPAPRPSMAKPCGDLEI